MTRHWSLRQSTHATFLLLFLLLAADARAQFFDVPIAGVEVDALGVLRLRTFPDPTGHLTRQRVAQMQAILAPELTRPSPLRKVSLTRLEAALAQRSRQGAELSPEMRYLAGLTRIEYLFIYPETREIVMAGPAEGFVVDLSGRALGTASGRAVLDLHDLVAALRAFPPDATEPVTIRCSIDPTTQGLQRMREYIASVSGRVTPADAERYAEGMRQSLGLQEVTIQGVSPRTHFAQVLVEADYRMKLIGIGLERPPVKITSFIQKASPAAVARNALQRWYFVPDYQAVQISDDQLAIQLIGAGVKLISEDEMVRADGTRVPVQRVNQASRAFAHSFTQRYAELAARVPIYAQLRNVIDLAIVAAFLQQFDGYDKAQWKPSTWFSEAEFPIETYAVPTHVESAINVVWKGSTLMTPIGGGVQIQADQAFDSASLRYEEDGSISQARGQVSAQRKPELDRWWWD